MVGGRLCPTKLTLKTLRTLGVGDFAHVVSKRVGSEGSLADTQLLQGTLQLLIISSGGFMRCLVFAANTPMATQPHLLGHLCQLLPSGHD